MPVEFDKLRIGYQYDRPTLAKIWGYAGFQAISRGVVTPANSNFIVLFVTEEKQESLTQYNDFLIEDKLHWEGEKKHGSDRRVIDAGYGPDQIHLFHRKRHHTDFTYHGQIFLEQHHVRVDAPSQFIFFLSKTETTSDLVGRYDVGSSDPTTNSRKTESVAIASSRLGQGVFRDGLFRMWGACAVTGYKRPRLLIASHIKPWKHSTDSERLDPHNGLLLQPTFDKLFDLGLITFSDSGEMIRSSILSNDELVTLKINPDARLREVFINTREYLRFHRENQFERFSNDG